MSYFSEEQQARVSQLVREIEKLNDVEKLLLYIQLPAGRSDSCTDLGKVNGRNNGHQQQHQQQHYLHHQNSKSAHGGSLSAGNSNSPELLAKKPDQETTRTYTWILSHLEVDPNVSLPKQEVYDEYRAFCQANRFEPLCVADFGKAMKHAFPCIKPRRLGQRGNSRYCYSGLRKKYKILAPTLPDLGPTNLTPAPQTASHMSLAGAAPPTMADHVPMQMVPTNAHHNLQHGSPYHGQVDLTVSSSGPTTNQHSNLNNEMDCSKEVPCSMGMPIDANGGSILVPKMNHAHADGLVATDTRDLHGPTEQCGNQTHHATSTNNNNTHFHLRPTPALNFQVMNLKMEPSCHESPKAIGSASYQSSPQRLHGTTPNTSPSHGHKMAHLSPAGLAQARNHEPQIDCGMAIAPGLAPGPQQVRRPQHRLGPGPLMSAGGAGAHQTHQPIQQSPECMPRYAYQPIQQQTGCLERSGTPDDDDYRHNYLDLLHFDSHLVATGILPAQPQRPPDQQQVMGYQANTIKDSPNQHGHNVTRPIAGPSLMPMDESVNHHHQQQHHQHQQQQPQHQQHQPHHHDPNSHQQQQPPQQQHHVESMAQHGPEHQMHHQDHQPQTNPNRNPNQNHILNMNLNHHSDPEHAMQFDTTSPFQSPASTPYPTLNMGGYLSVLDSGNDYYASDCMRYNSL